MNIELLTEHSLGFLSLKGDCKGTSGSTLFKMPHCWKSHVAALMYLHKLHFSDFSTYIIYVNEYPTSINFINSCPASKNISTTVLLSNSYKQMPCIKHI